MLGWQLNTKQVHQFTFFSCFKALAVREDQIARLKVHTITLRDKVAELEKFKQDHKLGMFFFP